MNIPPLPPKGADDGQTPKGPLPTMVGKMLIVTEYDPDIIEAYAQVCWDHVHLKGDIWNG